MRILVLKKFACFKFEVASLLIFSIFSFYIALPQEIIRVGHHVALSGTFGHTVGALGGFHPPPVGAQNILAADPVFSKDVHPEHDLAINDLLAQTALVKLGRSVDNLNVLLFNTCNKPKYQQLYCKTKRIKGKNEK